MIKQQVEELWRTCFKDTDEFVRFYFDRKYKDENTLVYQEDGRLVSALQMLPYPMTYLGTEILTSYISGASTAPSARSKGLMKNLLADAFAEMKRRGIGFTTLIPQESWLVEYYRKSGYTLMFDYTLENHHFSKGSLVADPNIRCFDIEKTDRLFAYFDREMHRRPCCIQHTREDFGIILQDLHMSGGKLLVAYGDHEKIDGMAFTLSEGDKGVILELLFASENVRQALLAATALQWNVARVECKTPAYGENRSSRGMARVIDAERLLALYAARYPHKSFTIRVTDPVLVGNTGIFSIKNAACCRLLSGDVDFDVDIPLLTRLLLGHRIGELSGDFSLFESQDAFMSLMLD